MEVLNSVVVQFNFRAQSNLVGDIVMRAKIFSCFLMCALLIFNSSICCAEDATKIESSPTGWVRQVIDEARTVTVAKKNSLTREQLSQELKKIILPVFDFEDMARRSLGSHWSNGSSAQQSEFVSLFSELLADNYLDQVIDGIDTCSIKYESERTRDDSAIVKTIISNDKDDILVDYRLKNKDAKWQVYDVIIQNIGLISNYRNEFAGIIRKDGFDGLIKMLKEKTASGATKVK